jgi:hypothetical protein
VDEETKARVLELLDRPIASLTVREGAFLLTALDEHEEEVLDLVPEIALLLGP